MSGRGGEAFEVDFGAPKKARAPPKYTPFSLFIFCFILIYIGVDIQAGQSPHS